VLNLKNKLTIFISLATLFLFTGCTSIHYKKYDVKAQEKIDEVISVEAESIIAPIPDNILLTQEQGELAAKRAAIEKAVGVYISGQIIVQKAQVIDEQIYSKTAGYIKSYKIISAGFTPEGLYSTKILAQVKLGDIKNDLDALGLLITSKKVENPRIIVIIEEKIDDKPSDTSICETAIMNVLLEKGYKVVEKNKIKEIIEKENITSPYDEPNTLIKYGRELNAELLIVGRAISQNVDNPILTRAGMVSYVSQLTVKVINISTNEVILTQSDREASPDVTKKSAANASLNKVAKKIAETIAPKIAQKLATSYAVILKISGIQNLNQIEKLKKDINYMGGVNSIILRSFGNNVAEFEITLTNANTEILSTKLESLQNWKIKVKSFTGRLIEAELY
jgi:hypothetical protein